MKKFSAGLIALATGSAVLTPTVAHADTETGDSQSVCLVDGQESDYKKAYYPEFEQTVESIATGAWLYHKYEDGVYSRSQYVKPNEVRYYSTEVFSDWIYGVHVDATEDRFNDYGRIQGIVDDAITECLDNVVAEVSGTFVPVELEPNRPAELPDADDVDKDPETQRPPASNGSSDLGSSMGALGLGLVAVVAAIIAAVSAVLPLSF